jgi:hypothetical protein
MDIGRAQGASSIVIVRFHYEFRWLSEGISLRRMVTEPLNIFRLDSYQRV